MGQKTILILFALLRSAIRGSQMSEEEKIMFSDDMLPELLTISHKHDIAHLIGSGLYINGRTNKSNMYYDKFQQQQMMAVYRYEKINYDYQELCAALESAEVPFVPLKGSVIRKYYPEGWMRTSCDIDVLVHETDIDKAVSYLVDNCGYTEKGKGSHDVSLFTPSGQHIELHYDLVEGGRANSSCKILKTVWNAVSNRDGYTYWNEMPDEMFYFYHIAHMAKHFENGGCGIRPFIDLWILDNLPDFNHAKREDLLSQGELLQFTNIARRLSKVWFEESDIDPITEKMQNYILRGGVYGTTENRVMVQQQKSGGRLQYAFSRIFLSYDLIKFHYPVLMKHRWLTPIMEIRRWFKLAFFGGAKRSMRELKYNINISDVEASHTQEFLKDIGL